MYDGHLNYSYHVSSVLLYPLVSTKYLNTYRISLEPLKSRRRNLLNSLKYPKIDEKKSGNLAISHLLVAKEIHKLKGSTV